MSDKTHDSTKPTAVSNALPAWIVSGILGLALGAGVMYLSLKLYRSDSTVPKGAGAESTAPPAGMMTGMGGMGGGGMGGGGMGGGGGGKRNLTSLVGKLELLSRANLKLHVELDAEQAKKLAAKLVELDKAEKMTAEEAQSHLDSLEALLTPEQKTTLSLIGLPAGRAGAGSGGGLGAAGRPGAGMPPPMAGAESRGAPPPMMMGGMGGGPSDENPFAQEANQKRLKDLLSRLMPPSAAVKSPAKPAAAKGSG